MPTKSERPLEHVAIDTMAAQIYQEQAFALSSLAEASEGGSISFALFAEWAILQLNELRTSGVRTEERDAARLIALTGSIQTYLENEHGVSFKPR